MRCRLTKEENGDKKMTNLKRYETRLRTEETEKRGVIETKETRQEETVGKKKEIKELDESDRTVLRDEREKTK